MGATPPTVLYRLKLHWCFGHGLKICMWFDNPQIIYIEVRILHLDFDIKSHTCKACSETIETHAF